MSVSIEDIARISGFAKSTVSASLNNKPGVSPETRERILNVALKMKYVPNELARSLSIKSTNTIGVLLRDITNPFYSQMCRAIEQITDERGYSLLLSNTAGNVDKTLRAIRMMRGKMVTGMVVDVTGDNLDVLWELKQSGVPFVLFGTKPGFIDMDSVEADDYTGAMEATEYLFKLGHTKIGFVSGGLDSFYSKRRLQGIKEAFLKNHVLFREDYVIHGAKTLAEGERIGYQLAQMADCPTAIIAYNDLVALGIIKAMHCLGKRVPEELSIIGFDNLDLMTFPLTTVSIPSYDMGQKATELLLKRIDMPVQQNQEILLPTKLIVRGSVKALGIV